MKKYVVLLVVLLFPRISTAHTRLTMSSGQNPKWASMPVPYWIQDKGLPGISNGSDFAAVQASFQTWQSIPTASIQFAYQGTTAAGTVGLDGMNLVTFTDTTAPLGTSVIAATFSFFKTENGALLFDEADIAFNPSLAFSTSAETGKFDIQSVLTHEIGHFLGLDHSALISSVMVPFGVPSQLDQRTLAYDDIAGVMEIYPNLSATPPTGEIQGTIQSSGGAVFGAHIIAIGSSGTAVSSTLSQKDGSYTLQFLPPDAYRIAVEPLDGPVTVQNVGGTNGFYGSSHTNFGTTYSGNVATLNEAALVDVGPGQTASADIKILPASTSGLNLTRPAFGIRIPAGQTVLSGVIGGVDLSSGVVFSASDPGIQFGAIRKQRRPIFIPQRERSAVEWIERHGWNAKFQARYRGANRIRPRDHFERVFHDLPFPEGNIFGFATGCDVASGSENHSIGAPRRNGIHGYCVDRAGGDDGFIERVRQQRKPHYRGRNSKSSHNHAYCQPGIHKAGPAVVRFAVF